MLGGLVPTKLAIGGDDSNHSISILSASGAMDEELLPGEYTPTDQLIKLC
jgi:hypothetical protein